MRPLAIARLRSGSAAFARVRWRDLALRFEGIGLSSVEVWEARSSAIVCPGPAAVKESPPACHLLYKRAIDRHDVCTPRQHRQQEI
jgi:hypothetical protein